MILLIDNYDSFVFNLERYFCRLGQPTRVFRNDLVDVESVRSLAPTAIVFSPGPCDPQDAGNSLDIARAFAESIPMLGVCLGHQILAEALGAKIVRAVEPMHGRTSQIAHDGKGVFAGLPSPFTVCRYHSLIVEPASLPNCLQPTATTSDGVLMAFRHREQPLVGLQFHPEAILTEYGYDLLANYLRGIGLPTMSIDSELPASERGVGSQPGDPASIEPQQLGNRSAQSEATPNRPITF